MAAANEDHRRPRLLGSGGDGNRVSLSGVACCFIVLSVFGLVWGVIQLTEANTIANSDIDWALGTCEIHAAMMKAAPRWSGGRSQTREWWVIMAYDVTVRPEGQTTGDGMRQPFACRNYDEGKQTCLAYQFDDPDIDCDTPVNEGSCDVTEQVPTDIWGQATQTGRNAFIECGCDICATSREACNPAAFDHAISVIIDDVRPSSCCYPNMPDVVANGGNPVGQSVDNEGSCVFPFNYEGKIYNSCTMENSDDYWCSHDANYDGDWGDCDLGLYHSAVTVHERYTPCFYDAAGGAAPIVELLSTEETASAILGIVAIAISSVCLLVSLPACVFGMVGSKRQRTINHSTIQRDSMEVVSPSIA